MRCAAIELLQLIPDMQHRHEQEPLLMENTTNGAQMTTNLKRHLEIRQRNSIIEKQMPCPFPPTDYRRGLPCLTKPVVHISIPEGISFADLRLKRNMQTERDF